MSFTGSYTKTNKTDVAPNAFLLTDVSSFNSEAKDTFSGRKVYLIDITGSYIQDANGNDYFDFPFSGGDTILINTLTADIALRILMVWDSLDPQQNSTYTDSQVFDFIDYLRNFMFVMVQNTAGNRLLNWPNGFYEGMSLMQTLIDTSNSCISNFDQYESQQAINLATDFSTNPNNFQ